MTEAKLSKCKPQIKGSLFLLYVLPAPSTDKTYIDSGNKEKYFKVTSIFTEKTMKSAAEAERRVKR